jgi:hypothetical protein
MASKPRIAAADFHPAALYATARTGKMRVMSVQTFFRTVAWLSLAAVVFSTLSPIGLRPVTRAPADMERFVAFFVIGGAFYLGYPRHRLLVVAFVIAAAGILEFGQSLIASRHGRMHDAAIKMSGALIGAALVAFSNRYLKP